jgi:hypothetical protein
VPAFDVAVPAFDVAVPAFDLVFCCWFILYLF